ncbi:MAG: hypothetical protein WBF58_17380 [Xanthobacteraceae bacterium]
MSVAGTHGFQLWLRRHALALVAVVGLCLPLVSAPAHAQSTDTNATTEGGAWILGDNLSLAALLYNQGASDDMVGHFLTRAKKIAEIFGVEIKPFPAKAATSAASSADIIHYLIKGDGAEVGAALSRKYNEEHGILFEVAVKSNLLILLYEPGDSLGRTVAEVIKSRLQSIHLPENLWGGVVTLVNNKASADDLKKGVFKMHKDIADYFIPGSG